MAKNCGNCKYSATRRMLIGTELREMGSSIIECRFKPPVPTLNGEDVFDKFRLTTTFAFPTAHPELWCGEHVEAATQ